jgi:hypothetical protein
VRGCIAHSVCRPSACVLSGCLWATGAWVTRCTFSCCPFCVAHACENVAHACENIVQHAYGIEQQFGGTDSSITWFLHKINVRLCLSFSLGTLAWLLGVGFTLCVANNVFPDVAPSSTVCRCNLLPLVNWISPATSSLVWCREDLATSPS